METFAKKRLEIIVETPVAKQACAVLEHRGVRAYTVMQTLRGLGEEGPWSGEGVVGAAGQMALILAVTTENRLDGVLDDLRVLMRRHFGYVTVTDCEVMRSDRF
ncbi:MAG: DUF190 domain-containing protein [Pseudomonadota bacterium]